MDRLHCVMDLARNEDCQKHSSYVVDLGTYYSGPLRIGLYHHQHDSLSMATNNIIYADLSTYVPKETMTFYERVFGWMFYEKDSNYFAYLDGRLVAGLYETPEKFKQMRMPHFWMSYVQVNDITGVVAKARDLGGIIEMERTIAAFGRVALIRDPQGAGFTVYEGENLQPTRTKNEANTLVWNELHVSNAQNVIPFYEGVFAWTLRQQDSSHFAIYQGKDQYIGDIWEIPNDYKGKYEYWICTFGVSNLRATQDKILENGGSIVADEVEKVLFTDNSNQAFFYVQEVAGE
ncbi:MAG: VOC family protein [Bacteroidota bacterium]